MWDYKIIFGSIPPDLEMLNREGNSGFELVEVIQCNNEWRSYLKRKSISNQLKQLGYFITPLDSHSRNVIEHEYPDVGLSEYLLDPLTRPIALELLESYDDGENKKIKDVLCLWKNFKIIMRSHYDPIEYYIQTYSDAKDSKAGFYASKSGVSLEWEGQSIWLPQASLNPLRTLFDEYRREIELEIKTGGDVIKCHTYSGEITLSSADKTMIVVRRGDRLMFITLFDLAHSISQENYEDFMEEMDSYRNMPNDWDYDDVHDSPGGVMRSRFWEDNGRYPEEDEL